MQLCDYGCGREAKYYFVFKTIANKWCCKNHRNKCPEMRRLNSESNKNKTKPLFSKEHRKNIGKAQKGKIPWNKDKIYTIKQIQKKYPTFSKEEEMRYNPDKLPEKEIQVHCKYSECKNSKENGGWFTPTRNQFFSRQNSLEKEDGNDGRYFYCSEKCKYNCCLFYIQSDPNILKEFERYIKSVYKETHKTRKKFKIKKIELQGKKHGYELDHKYSIYDGFINNVDPAIIAHYKNLQVITIEENRKKGKNSSITLEELLEEIKRERIIE